MKDPIIGIDLGTTNSAAAAMGDDGLPRVLADRRGFKIQPSVVSFHPSGSVLVGADAKQRRVIDAENTVYSSKRLMGRTFEAREVTTAAARMPYTIKEGTNEQPVVVTRAGEFAIPEIAAIVLDHMRTLASEALSTEVGRAVITVPANFSDAQRSATASAGAIAGLTVVRVINEPTAAALAYGHGRRARETIAVYDFGGGTFDVTLLRLNDDVYEVISTAGDSFLGGDDLDERLVEMMAQAFLERHHLDLREDPVAMHRLRAVAEQTKIELSRKVRATVTLDEIAYAPGGAPLRLEHEIQRDEFLARIGDLIDATFPVCRNALEMAGLQPSQIDEVVLVGGSTKLPHVRDRVAGFFGRQPRADVNPDEAVALGAAIQAEAMRRALGGAPRTTARAAAVAPPPPPMSGRRTPPPTPPPPPAEAVSRRLAPSPKRTARRAAATDARAAQPPPVDKLIAGPDDAATPNRPTEPRPAAPPAGPRMTAPQPFASAQPPAPASGPPAAPDPASEHDDFEAAATGVRGAGGTESASEFHDDTGAATGLHRPAGGPQAAPAADFEAAATGVRTALPAPGGDDAAGEGGGADASAAGIGLALGDGPPPESAPWLSDPADTDSPPPDEANVPAAVPAQVDGAIASALGATSDADTGAGPTVLDVVPQTLAIATVAGYCEEIIHRNCQVPCERSRTFAPSRDYQDTVRIRVCLGDSRRFDDNALLGEVTLSGLPPRPRAETQIAVRFEVDANGMLQVAARDEATGDERQVTLTVLGTQTNEQIEAARARLRELRDSKR